MNHLFAKRVDKLYTPGPVNIPERVYLASILGSYHHRTKEFSEILVDTLEMLKPFFGTKEMVMPVHTTGRGALEGIYSNLFTAKDRIVCVANGKFGEMAVETLQRLGIEVQACFEGWKTPVDLHELENLIVDFKATGLVSVFNDTSNGVINPISDMGRLARAYNLLFVVDNVSGLACMPFNMDEWGVDAVATASQKGLMSPVGVSFVAMSPKAAEVCKANPKRTLYVDFIDIRKILEKKGETPGSTPVSLILSVHEALNMMNEEGIEQVFLRHKAISEGTKAALEALGFQLYPSTCKVRSDSLSVALVPAGVSAKKLVAMLCEQFHLRIGTGLDAMADQAVRIAHMGYCYPEDMLECFAAMECILMELGYTECMGKGTAAFIKKYKALINQR